jgi:hypothetical protein
MENIGVPLITNGNLAKDQNKLDDQSQLKKNGHKSIKIVSTVLTQKDLVNVPIVKDAKGNETTGNRTT